MNSKHLFWLEVVVVILFVGMAIIGILLVAQNSKSSLIERAARRAQDLKDLNSSLASRRGTLPRTFTPRTGYLPGQRNNPPFYSESAEWYNECDRPNDWIPGLKNLPRDPTNNCLNNGYPRYQYTSDGLDYKVLVFRLGDEVCEQEEYREFIDPKRPCSNSYNASWAIYSPGAKNW